MIHNLKGRIKPRSYNVKIDTDGKILLIDTDGWIRTIIGILLSRGETRETITKKFNEIFDDILIDILISEIHVKKKSR